jgi:hypothetical protein
MNNIINDIDSSIKLDDYIIAKNFIVDSCHKLGINNVHSFGKINNPAISDLDVLIIGKPSQLKKINKKFLDKKRKSKTFGYIFFHEPVYLIEHLFFESKYLHSFNSIKKISKKSINKDSLKTSKKDVDVLHVAWFCFLLRVCVGIYKNIKVNKKVSLRFLLLVYSNIYESLKYFDLKKSRIIQNPKNLRKKILKKNIELVDVWKNFDLLFNETILSFDKYCENICPAHKVVSKKEFIIHKKITYVCSEKTKLNINSLWGIILLNRFAFSFIEDYFFFNKDSVNFKKYITVSNHAKAIYLKEGLDYPFIEPISLNKTKIIDQCLVKLNIGLRFFL